MFCPRCGSWNGDAALHCSQCGAPLGRIGPYDTGRARAPIPSHRRPRVAGRANALRKVAVPLLVIALLGAELWWVVASGFSGGSSVAASSSSVDPRQGYTATSTATAMPSPSPASAILPITPSPVLRPQSSVPSPALPVSPSPTLPVPPSPSPTPAPTRTATATVTPTLSPRLTATPSSTLPISPSPTLLVSPSPALEQAVMDAFGRLPADSAALFWNLAGSGRAELNATTRLPSASTIKLPLMIEVLQQAEEGRISLNQTHTITPDMVVGGTGILQGQVGRTLTTQDVLETTLTYSDNVGANLLLDMVGMGSVNATMQRLGFPSTRFERRLMDTEAQQRGLENRTSARDLAEMERRIYQGQLISPSASAEMMRILRLRGRQTSPALDTMGRQLLPRPDIAHISGNLVGVHNDAGIVQSGGQAYLLAILTHDQRNDSAAEDAIASVSARVFAVVMGQR